MQYFKRRFKMKRFIIFITALIALTVFFVAQTSAQTADTTKLDTNKVKVESFANAGFVSQYLWRGTMLDNRPNIQPILGVKICNLEVGAIGSLSFLNNYYEVDLYASYTYKFMKLTVTDFYIDLSGAANNQRYFNYSDTIGYHHVMCDLVFMGTEKIPVKLTASTMLYSGWDLNENAKSKFTTYVEARYLYKEWELYVGAISGQSNFYLNDVDGFNVVNVGAAYNYKIKFNDKYSLPSVAQICVNPQMEKIYLTFGVTF
jgi:hypothetical protein